MDAHSARPRVVLEADRCAAGDAVGGRVVDAEVATPVVLERVEERPQGRRAFVVACATPAGDGTFALAVPEQALPTAAGVRCALVYRVRAGGGAARVHAPLTVGATARPHLDDAPCRVDRLIRNWDARHFHIELSDAALHGGGRIAGRVHRHGAWRPQPMTIAVGCRESWRLPARTARGVPSWGEAWLWRHVARLEVDPDATWAGFDLALPAHLPPAVEARTIAWRYEIVVRSRPRRGRAQTAARTPLLHEEATLVWAEA
jgi:hypothetical protein